MRKIIVSEFVSLDDSRDKPKQQYLTSVVTYTPGGDSFILEDEDVAIPRSTLRKEQVKSEVARFKHALSKTKEEMHGIHSKAVKVFGKSHAKLMDAYLLILNDPFLNQDVIKLIEFTGKTVYCDTSDNE